MRRIDGLAATLEKLGTPAHIYRFSVAVIGIVTLLSCKQYDVKGKSSGPDSVESLVPHPITTQNPAAQRLFEQGLLYLYSFDFGDALQTFQRAAKADPAAAMPHWGLALALGPNYNSWHLSPRREQQAFESIQAALERSEAASRIERGYIHALAKRYSNQDDADQDLLGRAYSNAMRDFSEQNPDDPDLATLYAESLMDLHPWKLWSSRGEPTDDTLVILSVLERVLRQWPNHVGANHYYIHALEASPYPERALPSGKRLETLVPSAGHLVHMPAHVYFRTGDYIAAVNSASRAASVDQQNLATHPEAAGHSGYANHNLMFLVAAATMDGEFEVAWRAAKQLESKGHADAHIVAPLFVLARFARWDDILRLPEPGPGHLGARFFSSYARGCAFAAKNMPVQAQRERAAMEDVYSDLPQGRAFGMFFNSWSVLHELAIETLNARIAHAKGDLPLALVHWRAAILVQDQMAFDDLPDWYYPVRESLGATLLLNGQTLEAEKIFRKDLEVTPRNPRSLFGLWKTLDAQKRLGDAEWMRRRFESGWKGNALRIEDL